MSTRGNTRKQVAFHMSFTVVSEDSHLKMQQLLGTQLRNKW
ncbi:unnamed protein product [Acanthoscelides obtectus]|uniref:Uncharacterized protein n=1 Tax=Acanthoscelides obtectus TaxID=200917 RepID=A0A9P0LYS5_ACAOB|nr:unnamed protein product [Acanthoscelides obtectus]CAK1651575.1 hypothetical protein AOBTE_LOCUS17343 [Acanthoscelides obtectus]